MQKSESINRGEHAAGTVYGRHYLLNFMLPVLLVISLHMGCSTGIDPRAGGSTTETTNGVTAKLLLPGGEPAADLLISIRKSDYLSGSGDSVYTALTDTGGVFQFAGLPAGEYIIESVTPDSGLGCIIPDIILGTEMALDAEAADSIIKLPDRSLLPTGSLFGLVIQGSAAPEEIIDIQFYGTDFHNTVGTDSLFFMHGLPPYNYRMRITSSLGETAVREAVAVSSDDTVFIPGLNIEESRAFKGAKKIAFNTTSSGASIIGDVTEFPLLVRLNSGSSADSMIFADTRHPGSIRFLDSTNATLLPFSIERWDTLSSPKTAEIWIKVPVIFGNSLTDYITLLYGAGLGDEQRGDLVFERGQGYSAVWHCGEEAGTALFDETANQFNGAKKAAAEPLPVPGIIGLSQEFDGIDDWVDLGRQRDFLNQSSALSVSAWVYPVSYGFTVIDIGGSGEGGRVRIDITAEGTVYAGAQPDDSDTGLVSLEGGASLPVNSWSYISASFDFTNSFIEIYINGSPAAYSDVAFAQGAISADYSKESGLGCSRRLDSGFAGGRIDEVRIFRDIRSADWIRMCFESQRQDPTVIAE